MISLMTGGGNMSKMETTNIQSFRLLITKIIKALQAIIHLSLNYDLLWRQVYLNVILHQHQSLNIKCWIWSMFETTLNTQHSAVWLTDNIYSDWVAPLLDSLHLWWSINCLLRHTHFATDCTIHITSPQKSLNSHLKSLKFFLYPTTHDILGFRSKFGI